MADIFRDLTVSGIFSDIVIDKDYELKTREGGIKTGKFSGIYINSDERGAYSTPLFISCSEELKDRLKVWDRDCRGKRVQVVFDMDSRKKLDLKSVKLYKDQG